MALMETIFSTVFSNEEKIRPLDISAWMESLKKQHTTGLLRLSQHPDNRIVLFLYNESWHSPLNKSENLLIPEFFLRNSTDVNIRFFPLSPQGLSHASLLLQAQNQPQDRGLQVQSMPYFLDQAENKAESPYLVCMSWHHASASILFNTTSALPHSIYISENELLDVVGISPPIHKWKDDPSCVITVYSPMPSLDAWQDLLLRKAFKSLLEGVLERFEMFSGRVIIEAFSRILDAFAIAKKYDIGIQRRLWINNHFFLTTQEATDCYILVLKELVEHFSAVIGPRLLEMNFYEIYNNLLSQEEREILKAYGVLPREFSL